jgi:hypothetical protein
MQDSPVVHVNSRLLVRVGLGEVLIAVSVLTIDSLVPELKRLSQAEKWTLHDHIFCCSLFCPGGWLWCYGICYELWTGQIRNIFPFRQLAERLWIADFYESELLLSLVEDIPGRTTRRLLGVISSGLHAAHTQWLLRRTHTRYQSLKSMTRPSLHPSDSGKLTTSVDCGQDCRPQDITVSKYVCLIGPRHAQAS